MTDDDLDGMPPEAPAGPARAGTGAQATTLAGHPPEAGGGPSTARERPSLIDTALAESAWDRMDRRHKR